MKKIAQLEITDQTPLLLRKMETRPNSNDLTTSNRNNPINHMTVVTTPGFEPEKNDQDDDATRYDKD